MLDCALIVLMLALCGLAHLYVTGCDRLKGNPAMIFNALLLLVSFLLLVYLVYALLRPEKF